jgi:hypothetical protein
LQGNGRHRVPALRSRPVFSECSARAAVPISLAIDSSRDLDGREGTVASFVASRADTVGAVGAAGAVVKLA